MSGDRIIIVGGGAAGFFAAIACARSRPDCEVRVYERGSHFLSKVRISGGGRCNVTHSALEPRTFAARYPRGERALLGVLHRFSSEDTAAWFERHGVRLKTEPDGRVFPITDSSGTVIDCLMFEARAAEVQLISRCGVDTAEHSGNEFNLRLTNGETTTCERLLLATGGARTFGSAQLAANLGHTIEPPVPSLFSVHTDRPDWHALAGIAVADAEVSVPHLKLRERGPVLLTHNGLSGPAILRLSAWGARELATNDYRFPLRVNWLPTERADAIASELNARRTSQPKRRVAGSPIAPLPVRLWEKLVTDASIPSTAIWTELSRAQATSLVAGLIQTEFAIKGKSLNKDEFVTCGGVQLREVNFRTMESRLVPHLYFAGELLDIDGITGGFNFQAAWATGWIAGHAMADAPLPK